MLASKAQNMMEYSDQIYNRPEKKWFQTSKEKKATLDAAHVDVTGEAVEEEPAKGRKGRKIKEEGTKVLPKKKEKNMSRKERRAIKFGVEETMDEIVHAQHSQKAGKAATKGEGWAARARPSGSVTGKKGTGAAQAGGGDGSAGQPSQVQSEGVTHNKKQPLRTALLIQTRSPQQRREMKARKSLLRSSSATDMDNVLSCHSA